MEQIAVETNSNKAVTITKSHLSQAEKEIIFRQVVEVARFLSESNMMSVSKLIRTFGLEIVQQKANEAKELYAQAQAQGELA